MTCECCGVSSMEIETLKAMIRELECYGEWCGKSPTDKDPGLCPACTAQKQLMESEHG